jgi:hypothetical protein
MANPQARQIAQVLSAETSPLRDEALDLVVDFVLTQPVKDIIDVDGARRVAMGVLTEENLQRIVARHVKPGWQRYAAAARDADLAVGALVPDEARGQIRDTLLKGQVPKGKWAEGAVDPALIRKLFAPVFAQLLVNFAKKMPLPGVGGNEGAPSSPPPSGREGGLAGRFAQKMQKRAGRIMDAGLNAMGGLGAEMERRVQAAAKDFSEGALTMWREAMRDRLRSEEGRALVLQMSQQATDHVMATEVSQIHRDAEGLPIEEILDVVPSIVAHAVPHGFIQGIVDRELAAFLEVEGERPVGELLDELGVTSEVRAVVRGRGSELARALFATSGFEAWLERLLDASS